MSSNFLPGLRRAAPRLSKNFFQCQHRPAISKTVAPQRAAIKTNFFHSTPFSSATTPSGGIAKDAQKSASKSSKGPESANARRFEGIRRLEGQRSAAQKSAAHSPKENESANDNAANAQKSTVKSPKDQSANAHTPDAQKAALQDPKKLESANVNTENVQKAAFQGFKRLEPTNVNTANAPAFQKFKRSESANVNTANAPAFEKFKRSEFANVNTANAPAFEKFKRSEFANVNTANAPAFQKTFKKPKKLESANVNTANAQKTAAKSRGGSTNGKSWFPELSSKSVAYWLLGSAASVFGIVVFGGLTRLTESGLSITEWKPVTGSLPPMSDEDWDMEFTKYKSSPEYKQLNANMDLGEFKKIYFMEWAHRLWGRVVGLSFVLPAIYFVARRKVSANMSLRLLGISGLIGFQGVIGWWMVKSGLKDDLFEPGAHPRVSQYRLATHLGTAFICYSAMLMSGLSILREHKLLADPFKSSKLLNFLKSKNLSIFRKSVAGLAGLVFLTVLGGALVAGLDAGMIYNEWPTMAGGLHPPGSELFDKFYCRKEDGSDLIWRNMLENPSTVQLNHRMLAYTTFISVVSLYAYSKFGARKRLPKDAKKGILGVVHLVTLQAVLGITTLLYLVPVHLAATHQAGSLALLTGVLVLGNRVWVPKRTLLLVERSLKAARSGGAQGVVVRRLTSNRTPRTEAKHDWRRNTDGKMGIWKRVFS